MQTFYLCCKKVSLEQVGIIKEIIMPYSTRRVKEMNMIMETFIFIQLDVIYSHLYSVTLQNVCIIYLLENANAWSF